MNKDFLKILKDNDLKITKNRMAILKELKKKEIPLTVEDIYKAMAMSRTEKYSISSVYRALTQFCDKNIVKKTAEIDGTTYYQLNNGHAHSLICEKCKKIIPINHCPIHPVVEEIESKTEFLITGHHLEIRGVCKDCRNKMKQNELDEIMETRKESLNYEHTCKDEKCI